mmetsp:Transcript_27528/g.42988  ORF Transcript_27528/g.42988 Transcript_27528/m.42988 type:complete len:92 (-) Transcript_27528:341-616(-)
MKGCRSVIKSAPSRSDGKSGLPAMLASARFRNSFGSIDEILSPATTCAGRCLLGNREDVEFKPGRVYESQGEAKNEIVQQLQCTPPPLPSS